VNPAIAHHACCPICNGSLKPFGAALVLGRHQAEYAQCERCGFALARDPYWLAEAYSSAITSTDIGYASRCLDTARLTQAVINNLFTADGEFLDYGGGYGLFTRMMRDRGFNFRCFDPYCENLFAAGFFHAELPTRRFTLATCFEVFEHLTDPYGELAKIDSAAEAILFTTVLISRPAPALDTWWYYGTQHGQHVAFYTREALELLGKRFGLHLASNGSHAHLFSRRKVSEAKFRFLSNPRVASALNLLQRHRSLLQTDYDMLVSAIKAGNTAGASKPPHGSE